MTLSGDILPTFPKYQTICLFHILGLLPPALQYIGVPISASESIKHLHRELADFIQAKDDEGVRRVYRDLLRTGRSRQETMGDVIHLATAGQDASESPCDSPRLLVPTKSQDQGASNVVKHRDQFIQHPPVVFQSPTNLYAPVIGSKTESAFDNAGPEDPNLQEHLPIGHFPAPQWTVWRSLVLGVSILALGGLSGVLVLHTSGRNYSGATTQIAAPTAQEIRAAGAQSPAAGAASVATLNGAADVAPEPPIPPNRYEPSSTPSPAISRAATTRVATISGAVDPDVNSSLAPKSSIPLAEQSGSAQSIPAYRERGDALLAMGDLAAARLFYERAADAGDGEAALRLGETYDPDFLTRIRFYGVQGSRLMAAHWYQRARELGAGDAEILLKAVSSE